MFTRKKESGERENERVEGRKNQAKRTAGTTENSGNEKGRPATLRGSASKVNTDFSGGAEFKGPSAGDGVFDR
jgi:hypothetical protein